MSENYLRYPHVSGRSLVFTADDDVWLGTLDGGPASRLTTDHVPVRFPLFNPSGTRIAWAAELGGRPDVQVLDLRTGEQRRITWWSTPGTAPVAWADDEHVVVASAHQQHYNRLTMLYTVSLDGQAVRLEVGPAMGLAVHDDLWALNTPNSRDSAMWKRYRGGMASKLWLRAGGAWAEVLPEEQAGKYSPGWFGDRLFFSSDLEASIAANPDGQAQLCSVDATGADLRIHTRHTPEQGYVRNPTTDGHTIVYHAHGRLYALDGLDAAPREIPVDLRLGAPVAEPVSPMHRLETIAPDHTGNNSLLEWRGTVWWLTHRGGPARALAADQGVRTREPDLLGQTGLAAWVSDKDGDDRLEIGTLDGSTPVRALAHGRLGRVLHLRSNPQGTHVAVAAHDGRVLVVSVDDGTVTTAGRSLNGEPTGLAWSPDGRFLVWRTTDARPGEGEIGYLTCFDTTDGTERRLTSGRFNEFDPAFTPDGRYLVFLSQRTFDPHYDELAFDLAFGESVRPWLVPLRADDPAPFGPSADGWPVSEPSEAAQESGQHGVAEQAKESDEPEQSVQVTIDFEGIEQRMLPFPVQGGDLSDLQVVDGGIAWLRDVEPHGVLGAARVGHGAEEPSGQLERFGFATRTVEVIAEHVDGFAASGDGKRLVVRTKDELLALPSERRIEDDDPGRVVVDLARLRRQVSPRAEFRQMFEENGRLMRDHYWRADLDGVDWNAVLTRYRPVIDTVRTHDDLVDVLWEVVSELNTSHSYVTPPPGVDDPQRRVGLLGADLEPVAEGARIARILPGESSDPKAMSPLLAAGVAARAGDVIVAVDGQPVAEAASVGELLQGSVGKVVELTLDRGRQRRRVAVVPLAEEETIRYHDWVARNGRYVEEHSGGRLGYVHVPDMTGLGWAQLYRMLAEATRHDGVVLDVRYNRGGHTSQLVIEQLARKVVGWDVARHYETPLSYPDHAVRGPVVLVANRYSGSDGDIVNAAAQAIGLGPVVGERTWGGVIGIDGRYDLVDGTEVTQPRYAFWIKGRDWGVENHGVDPDIPVIPTPDEWEAFWHEPMRDIQLDRAIEWALAELERHPAEQPPAFPAPRVRKG